MRSPSEPRELKWTDIDWKNQRVAVTAPKTEHHGNGKRVMPLFPELAIPLREVFEQAEEGAEYVLPKLRNRKYNPATHMRRIVERACGVCWPKVFQNCRSTRQTELGQQFPSHVVTKWLGNSEKIAEQFYLQVTDEHFKQALIQPEAESEAIDAESKQKPKQHTCARVSRNQKKTSKSRVIALAGLGSRYEQVPVRGLEPPRGCPQWILNPSRLPIPPHRHFSISRNEILINTRTNRQVPCSSSPQIQRNAQLRICTSRMK